MTELLESLGIDPDRTPVDTLMDQPLGVALVIAHYMEYADDCAYEE